MSQSCACSLFLAKTNEKDACSRVPQSSSLLQSCAKEKSSGVEIVRLPCWLRSAIFVQRKEFAMFAASSFVPLVLTILFSSLESGKDFIFF